MTLVEQIKTIHAKHFNKEFHEYRGDLIPATVNDLKMKFFDNLVHSKHIAPLSPTGTLPAFWYWPDTVEMRAIRKASELIQATGLRENTPAVE